VLAVSYTGVRRIVVLSALLGVVGCETFAPRIVPLQNARGTQVERFEQYFVAHSVPHAERVFLSFLGKKNYDALTAEEWMPYIQKLVNGSIRTVGGGTFIISLLPDAYDQFVVRGWGQLSAVDISTEQVLMSGTFDVPNAAPIPVTALGGPISVRVRQRVFRHFALERANYEHESEVVVRFHTRRLDRELYTIDYGAGHEVGVLGDRGELEVIGCLEFADKGAGQSAIDLRGRDLLRNDYKERFAKNGFSAAPPNSPPVPAWAPMEDCARRHGGHNCACPRVGSR
jgi:hypothetical protein